MKTLNRTLSLTLVFALVFSLMSFAFAADTTTTTTTTTGYTDAASITYKEAVDVATAIGVFQGNDSKAFAPKDNLTREQAAKVICYLTMGKAAADKLSASADPFTDVPAARWSAGSVAYCKQQGIIAGYGDGKFGPTDTVTGYQFAKMLLVALGYDATIEQFNGSDWSVNVAKRAFQNKLFTGNNAFVGTAPAIREEATLYVLNTLQAGLVTYETKGTEIKLPDGTTIRQGASAPKQETGSFMKSNYPTLKVENGTDAFGRAANVWTLKGVEIGRYATEASIVITEDKNYAAGKQDLAKTLKNYTINSTPKATTSADVVISINGKNGATLTKGAVDSTAIDTIAGLTGNGVKVEIFVDDVNAKVITGVSVIKTDLTVVKAVNTTSKTINLVTFGLGGVQGSYTVRASDNEALYESLKGLPIDTPVLVTPNYDSVSVAYGVASAQVPQIVTGKVTATSGAAGSVDGMTVNGKAYDVAAIHSNDVLNATVDTKNDATILLDAYGYVVHFKGSTAAAANAAVVLDTYQTLVNNQIVPMAKIVLNDGTTTDVAVAEGSVSLNRGGFYKVSPAGTAYKFEAYSAGTTAGTYVALKDTGRIDASDRALDTDATSTGATTYYAPNVKFIFVSTASKTATVKEGVQSVPSISSSGDKLSVAVIGTTTATGTTPVVTAVYIVDGVAASTDINSIVYFKSGDAVGATTVKNAAGNDVPVYLYNGYINGELVKNMPVFGTPDDNSFFVFAKNANGSYTIGNSYNATTAGATAVQVNKAIEGTALGRYITVNTNVQIDAGAALIVDTRSSDDKIALPIDASLFGLMSALRDNTVNVSAVYNATTGNAAVIYITSAAAIPSYTVTPASVTPAKGLTATVTADKATARAGETVTVTVKLNGAVSGGADATVTTAGTYMTTIPTLTGVTRTSNTVLTIANGTDLGTSGYTVTYTFVMGSANAAPTVTIA